MSDNEPDDTSILDTIFEDDIVMNGIYDRYEKYKTEESYFFVPIVVRHVDNKLIVNVGDKSYKTITELENNMKLWFSDEGDVDIFKYYLWESRNENIVIMILIETEYYKIGTVAICPVKRGEDSSVVVLYCDDVQEFSYMVDPPLN